MVILLGLLLIIWHKKIKVALKLSSILLFVNSLFLIIIGITGYISISIMSKLELLPQSLISYKDIIQQFINPIAFISLICAIVLMLIGAVLFLVVSNINKKNKAVESDTIINNTENAQSSVIEDKNIKKSKKQVEDK
jgi:membrane-bound ClpP family serine protease